MTSSRLLRLEKFSLRFIWNKFSDGCFKQSMHEHHAKDACCGIYPNRLPFDTLSRECCRKSAQDGDNTFSVDTLGSFSNSILVRLIKIFITPMFVYPRSFLHVRFRICNSPCKPKIVMNHGNHVIKANLVWWHWKQKSPLWNLRRTRWRTSWWRALECFSQITWLALCIFWWNKLYCICK